MNIKEKIVEILKDHVKENKLDEFGVLFVTSYIISVTKSAAYNLAEALKELGVKNDK